MTCPSSPGCGSCPQTTTEPIVIHHNHRTLVALAAISLAGCDALTDDDYRGEAVLSLTGTVDSQGAVAPQGDVNIYLVWHDTVDTPKTAVQLDVRSVFPATFQLNMFTLPPIDPPYEDFSGGEPDILRAARLNSAHIIAATPDADFRGYKPYPTDHRGPGILGVDPRHIIIYVPDGVPEDSVTASTLHGTFDPGFHVIDLKCIGPAKAAEIDACLARYRAEGRPRNPWEIFKACGAANSHNLLAMPAPDDLETELTVELIDDLASYQPDPSECL
jgi:hypothetical protein